jgi:hypothetical protein
VPGSYSTLIISKARDLLIKAQQSKQFPRGNVSPGTPTAEIIQRSRPQKPENGDAIQIPWHGFWLATWVYGATPDAWVRSRAIELALVQVAERPHL